MQIDALQYALQYIGVAGCRVFSYSTWIVNWQLDGVVQEYDMAAMAVSVMA